MFWDIFFEHEIDNQTQGLSMKLGLRNGDLERSLGAGYFSQAESVGVSHSNVGHLNMYLPPLACKAQGYGAVFIHFLPQGWGHAYCHSSHGRFPESEQWGMVESSHETS